MDPEKIMTKDEERNLLASVLEAMDVCAKAATFINNKTSSFNWCWIYEAVPPQCRPHLIGLRGGRGFVGHRPGLAVARQEERSHQADRCVCGHRHCHSKPALCCRQGLKAMSKRCYFAPLLHYDYDNHIITVFRRKYGWPQRGAGHGLHGVQQAALGALQAALQEVKARITIRQLALHMHSPRCRFPMIRDVSVAFTPHKLSNRSLAFQPQGPTLQAAL